MSKASKPISLVQGHRTKKEKEQRKDAEKALYTGIVYRESDEVKNNKNAHKLFLRLQELYNEIDFIDGLDEQMINRYCLETAEVQSLSKLISNMEKDIENCEEYKDRIQLYKAVSSTISLKLRKNEALTKLEDRMFLSPAARVKSVPKKVVKETAAPSRMAELRQKRGE